jgi:hypothetical protein
MWLMCLFPNPLSIACLSESCSSIFVVHGLSGVPYIFWRITCHMKNTIGVRVAICRSPRILMNSGFQCLRFDVGGRDVFVADQLDLNQKVLLGLRLELSNCCYEL